MVGERYVEQPTARILTYDMRQKTFLLPFNNISFSVHDPFEVCAYFSSVLNPF